MTAESFKREMEYSEALWAAQKRFLATIDPRLAEDFQPLSSNGYIAHITYLHARLARDPDVRRHYDRFIASLTGPGARHVWFWKISIYLPLPVFDFCRQPVDPAKLAQTVRLSFEKNVVTVILATSPHLSFSQRSPAPPQHPERSNIRMSTNPLVSIGLFLYNGDRFLAAAIESILNQTFKDFELIISDNCSTDRSEEICRKYAAQDDRIRYYRADRNMGAGWNLRNVYFKATGKYFKWAAHDDMIQPDFLRLCVDALEADDSLVVAHTLTRVIDEHGQFVENYEWPLRTESPRPRRPLQGSAAQRSHVLPDLWRDAPRALCRQLPPQGSYVNSDGVLLAQMGLLGRFHETPEFLFISTRHSKQSSQAKPVRLKAPRFRLTNRHGTLPGPEWWDPNKTTSITFPGMAHVPRILPKHPPRPADHRTTPALLSAAAALAGQAFPPHGQRSVDRGRSGSLQAADAAHQSFYGERNISRCCLVTKYPPK